MKYIVQSEVKLMYNICMCIFFFQDLAGLFFMIGLFHYPSIRWIFSYWKKIIFLYLKIQFTHKFDTNMKV